MFANQLIVRYRYEELINYTGYTTMQDSNCDYSRELGHERDHEQSPFFLLSSSFAGCLFRGSTNSRGEIGTTCSLVINKTKSSCFSFSFLKNLNVTKFNCLLVSTCTFLYKNCIGHAYFQPKGKIHWMPCETQGMFAHYHRKLIAMRLQTT